MVEPTHALVEPLITPTVGKGLTVICAVEDAEHPFTVAVYVIIAVPAVTPVTTPEELMVATAELEVVQTPFGFVFASVAVEPAHNEVGPVIGAPAPELIVTLVVALLVHPFTVTVYVITAVPAETPVTTPEELTVATAELEVDQTPPLVASESVVVEPTQVEVKPVMGATGQGLQLSLCAKFK